MAPTSKVGIRTVDSDPQFMLLYYVLKHGGDVSSEVWEKVSQSMGLSSGSAASQRFGRLMKAQDASDGTTTDTASPAKAVATPKKRGGVGKKKKAADADVDSEADADQTPKKSKLGKVKPKQADKGEVKMEEIHESIENGVEDAEEASTIKDEDYSGNNEAEADELA